MSEHSIKTVERHCDVAIVGGSAAGLAAALQLGRQRRSVIVIDSGEPRNAPAAHMHSYLGHEGAPPSEFAAIGRAEVRSYGVEILAGSVVGVDQTGDDGFRFRVALDSGHAVLARRVLAATGLVDVLPEIRGVSEQWGRDVIHCPFCHGFEVRDQRIVQIVTHLAGLHPAAMFRQLTDRFTMVLHGELDVVRADVDALIDSGVNVIERAVSSVMTNDHGRVAAVELIGGDHIDADAVVVTARFRVRAEVFGSLGLEPVDHPSGLGDFIETDETGETSVPGLYAAGNLTDPSQQVLQAAANGSRVGAVISSSLAHEDVELVARPSSEMADWDHRYSGDHIWSGEPNHSLVAELTDVSPGRALDVGAGEGGDAIWLAEQGWKVTASDISQRALHRITSAGHEHGFEIETHHTDANDLDAFESVAYDLVTAHYVPIQRTPDDRGVHNLLGAVAPGGTLLVVSHDLEQMRTSAEAMHGQPYDPDAYLNVGDFVKVLEDSPEWEVETHETRARPDSKPSPHVNDVVLRARRAP